MEQSRLQADADRLQTELARVRTEERLQAQDDKLATLFEFIQRNKDSSQK